MTTDGYTTTFTRFSGTEFSIWLKETKEDTLWPEIHGITYSVCREAAPIYTHRDPGTPITFARGKRSLAGQILSANVLPPFADITMTWENEDNGMVQMVKKTLYGISWIELEKENEDGFLYRFMATETGPMVPVKLGDDKCD